MTDDLDRDWMQGVPMPPEPIPEPDPEPEPDETVSPDVKSDPIPEENQ